MENHTIIRPEHLNHYGYLFGGVMLKWADEFAWIAASSDYPDCSLVTIAMDNVEFRKRISNGSILRFKINRIKQGTTSAQYLIEVFAKEQTSFEENKVFSTKITFVRIDESGNKCPLPV